MSSLGSCGSIMTQRFLGKGREGEGRGGKGREERGRKELEGHREEGIQRVRKECEREKREEERF